jgi:carboxyl-terminal processing protease
MRVFQPPQPTGGDRAAGRLRKEIRMNRLIAGLFALAVFVQTGLGAEVTRVQANRIGNVVGRVLEQAHFRQAPLSDTISGQFLTNYLNALDYNHMIFLQSDVDTFKAKYTTKLDDALRAGDVSPAFQIYQVYLDRLAERNILVQKLLKQEFDFSEDETFIPGRNKEPWPKDDAEAAKLWRQRVKFELLQSKLANEKPEETIGLISRRYNRLEKTWSEFDTGDILQIYLSALAHAYDPHSDYMSPSEAQNFNITHISLSLSGIGAQLVWEDGYTKIRELIPGGPAALSKQLRPGDKIVAVAQAEGEAVDVIEMRLNKVVDMIRGKKGTEVRLTVVPAKDPDTKKVISLVRDEIKFKEQFAKAKVYDYTTEDGEKQRIGVITLPQFYDNCAQHIEKLIERLKTDEVNSIVLDLRRNGGGILDEAIELTGLFIKKGPVVQVKEPRKDATVLEDRKGEVAWDGPLVVAVGKLSASASEIVAAALQDYGRALIVGDQSTHGKGTVQQVLPLEQIIQDRRQVPNPGNLKLTVSKFYRIAGNSTQRQGLTPDIVLPSIYDHLDIGEASLDNALPPDQTTPATYSAMDLVKPYLTELEANSKARVAANKDFAYIIEDIEQVKKRKDDKAVSLNEQKRLAEKEEDKARTDSRKKERASRTKSAAQIYELDLDMVAAETPLRVFTGEKTKEEAELVQAAPPVTDGEEVEDPETNPLVDPHLDETLQIMRDYMAALANKGRKPVVTKKD